MSRLKAAHRLEQLVVVARLQRRRTGGAGEQYFAQQRHTFIAHSGSQRRAVRQWPPGGQRRQAQPRIGGAQVAVQRKGRAGALEGLRQIGKALHGDLQQLLAIVALRGVGAAPDLLDIGLAQATTGQMVQRFQIGVAGEDVSAFAMQRRGRRLIELLAYARRLILRRVQTVIGQLRELLQQAVERRIGIPHRLVMHGCIECRQSLQRLWFQPVRHRRAALWQAHQRGFERRRRRDERLCRGRDRGEAEPDGKTKCTFFEQFIAPGHSRDC